MGGRRGGTSTVPLEADDHSSLEPRRKDDRTLEKTPRIHVALPPTREIPADTEVELICAFTGEPQPSVSWLKDDLPVSSSSVSNASASLENGVARLTLRRAKMEHSGVYTAIASNPYGSVRTTGLLQIQPKTDFKYLAPTFSEPLSDRSVDEGVEVKLSCRLSGRPTPEIVWHKDGFKILPSVDSRILMYMESSGEVSLSITRVRAEDSGEYSCEAKNSEGSDFTHCQLRVRRSERSDKKEALYADHSSSSADEPSKKRRLDAPAVAPVIVRPLKDAYCIHEGNRELIECELDVPTSSSDPSSQSDKTECEWFRNAEPLVPNKTLRTHFDGRLALLKIYQASMDEHAGAYECRFTNSAGRSTSSRCTVTIEPIKVDANAATQSATDGTFNPFITQMPSFVQKLAPNIDGVEGEDLSRILVKFWSNNNRKSSLHNRQTPKILLTKFCCRKN